MLNSQAFSAIQSLRQELWSLPNQLQKNKNRLVQGRDVKNLLLLRKLMGLTFRDDNGVIKIQYTFNGNVNVCMSFYQQATGIPYKKFKMYVKYVTFSENDDINSDFDRTWLQRIHSLLLNRNFKNICGDVAIGGARNVFVMRALLETQQVKRIELRKGGVIAYLDRVFCESDIDLAPELKETKYTRQSWLALYMEYTLFCEIDFCRPLSYPRFTSIR